MKNVVRLLALMMCLLCSACGEPAIDTSSDERLQESVAEIRESLPEDQREDFDLYLQEMALDGVDLSAMFVTGEKPDPDALVRGIKDKLEGMTASEVMAEGRRIAQARELREREQALQELAELEEKARAGEAAAAELAKFAVSRSRFYKQPQRFGQSKPVIELTVSNGTEVPVSRAYFMGTIASPGRSIPWLKEEFNYGIRGGLEPGEKATWRLAPNMFSEWGQVDPPADAIFTVEVVKLDGPDGEAALDARGLNEFEQARLESLQETYRDPVE